MIEIKNQKQIVSMTKGGTILSDILVQLLEYAKPGRKLIEIDNLAKTLIKKAGGQPSFMTVEDYKWATCLCVNDVVVHGIPTDQVLVPGDVLTIDVGIIYEGLHTDTAWTKIITDGIIVPDKKVVDFIECGKKTLELATQKAIAGNYVGDISSEIEKGITEKGYSVIKALVGHGVGTSLHMDPQIPGFIRGDIKNSPKLLKNMTVAIEVIYSFGSSKVEYLQDNWSIATVDGSLTSVFEHTVLISDEKPIILTKLPEEK